MTVCLFWFIASKSMIASLPWVSVSSQSQQLLEYVGRRLA